MKRLLEMGLKAALVTMVAVLPLSASAAVGKIAVLQGKGTRTPQGGEAVALAVGTEVELGDVLKVDKGGAAKLVLTDESVLAIGGDSELVINEAEFSGLDRKGFSAKLMFGKVWAKVKKAAAGSEAKFEVTTERAVAGVRGTVFRVDATQLLKAASTGKTPKAQAPKKSITTVRVKEGLVAVEAQVRKPVAAAQPQPKGERRQVAGPQEISKDEWEKKFVELQAKMQVTVGEELWQVGAVKNVNDDLDKFFAANP